jgi:TPR repeat protein
LGNLYHKGELVEQNFEKAFYWYEKAAKRDFDKAQNNLGNM